MFELQLLKLQCNWYEDACKIVCWLCIYTKHILWYKPIQSYHLKQCARMCHTIQTVKRASHFHPTQRSIQMYPALLQKHRDFSVAIMRLHSNMHTKNRAHSILGACAMDLKLDWIHCVCMHIAHCQSTFVHYSKQQTKTKIIMDFMSIKQSFHSLSLCNLAWNECEKYMRYRHKVRQYENNGDDDGIETGSW